MEGQSRDEKKHIITKDVVGLLLGDVVSTKKHTSLQRMWLACFLDSKYEYCLVWATLKTDARAALFETFKIFYRIVLQQKLPCYFGINRKLIKRPFQRYLSGRWGLKIDRKLSISPPEH